MPYPEGLSYGPESRVVLVGTTICDKDPTHLPPLPHVERNINRLKELFANPDVIGLPPSSILPIVDWAEASAVVSAIAAAASEANDTLIVYYAGHGLYGDLHSPLYLATKNTVNATKTWSGIDITKVKAAISSSPARKRILILDCCYGGAAFKGGMSAQGVAVQDMLPAIDIKGTCGIAAVPADYKALAPEGATYTKFTQHLIDVLEGGIAGDTPVLTLGEVFKAVKTRVGRESDMPLPEQINSNECMLFHLAKNRYLKLGGLDRVFSGLARVGEAVERMDKRLQTQETKINAVAGLERRLDALESRLAAALPRSIAGESPHVPYRVWWWKISRTALLVAAIDAITYVGLWLNLRSGMSATVYGIRVQGYLVGAAAAHTFLIFLFFLVVLGAARNAEGRMPTSPTFTVQLFDIFAPIARHVSAGTMLVNSMLVLALLAVLSGVPVETLSDIIAGK